MLTVDLQLSMQQMVKLSDDRCHSNILAVSFLFSKYIAIIQRRNERSSGLNAEEVLTPSRKEYNYELRASKNSSCMTKFLVNNIHIYGFESIYYANTFRN